MITYKLTTTDAVIKRDSENPELFVSIPYGHRNYQEYLEWVAQGNTPEPADEVIE